MKAERFPAKKSTLTAENYGKEILNGAENITGIPESHKEELDKIFSSFLNDQDSDGALFKYILGVGNEKPSSIDFDNLDIATLDTENIKKIVERAKKRYESLYTRRSMNYKLPKLDLKLLPQPQLEYSVRHRDREHRSALQNRKDYVVIAFDLMAQSIYSTRYRLMETKEYRQKYSSLPSYQIGVMIGSIMELKSKMAHLYAHMYWMETRTHFIWYLILYEKMLTCFTDIMDQINRIFIIHRKNVKLMRVEQSMMANLPQNYNPGGNNTGSNHPGGDNPWGNNPGGNNPGGNNPGGNNPGGNNPGGNNPDDNYPDDFNADGNNPGGNNPGGNNPGGNNPGGNNPGGNNPGGNNPAAYKLRADNPGDY